MDAWRVQLRTSRRAPMRKRLQYRGQRMLREELNLGLVEESDVFTISADGCFSCLLLVVKGAQRFAIGVCGLDMYAANTIASGVSSKAWLDAPIRSPDQERGRLFGRGRVRWPRASASEFDEPSGPSRMQTEQYAGSTVGPSSMRSEQYTGSTAGPSSMRVEHYVGSTAGQSSKRAEQYTGSTVGAISVRAEQYAGSTAGPSSAPSPAVPAASRHPLADIAFHERAMRFRGWKPVLLPYWEWELLLGSEPSDEAAKRVVLNKLDKALRLRGILQNQNPE